MNKKKYYTYELDMIFLNILAIILFFILFIPIYYYLFHHSSNIAASFNIPFFIYLIFWLALHELLHGLGFSLFKIVNKKNITFGIALEKGVFYCMCKQRIPRKVILTSLLFPLSIIGIITLIIGFLINNTTLILLSVFNIVGSIGDIIMTLFFLIIPKEIEYIDQDDATSFTVISKKDLSNIKINGIKIKEQGLYDENKIKATNYKKIIITKKSYPILIIFLIIIVMNQILTK